MPPPPPLLSERRYSWPDPRLTPIVEMPLERVCTRVVLPAVLAAVVARRARGVDLHVPLAVEVAREAFLAVRAREAVAAARGRAGGRLRCERHGRGHGRGVCGVGGGRVRAARGGRERRLGVERGVRGERLRVVRVRRGGALGRHACVGPARGGRGGRGRVCARAGALLGRGVVGLRGVGLEGERAERGVRCVASVSLGQDTAETRLTSAVARRGGGELGRAGRVGNGLLVVCVLGHVVRRGGCAGCGVARRGRCGGAGVEGGGGGGGLVGGGI